MGALECAGCTFIAFGPTAAMFIFTIAPDPLRVILFVAGAFFWLVSLLVSSILWFAVVPWRDQVAFGLVFAVIFQELFRFIYFLLLEKAETGLKSVATTGAGGQIEGVHSLQNAKHTIAYVCGLGFGFMSGAFSLVNVLADATGPGTPGFPYEAGLDGQHGHGNFTFFLVSALTAAAFILLHIFWNIIFFNGLAKRQGFGFLIPVLGVIICHFVVSLLSLCNRAGLAYLSVPLTYVIMLAMAAWAYVTVGGTRRSLRLFVNQTFSKKSASHDGDGEAVGDTSAVGDNDRSALAENEGAPATGPL